MHNGWRCSYLNIRLHNSLIRRDNRCLDAAKPRREWRQPCFFHLQQFAKVICHILSFNNLLRGCLVPYKIQNAKCQLLWSDEMQNTKIFRIIFSSIQNTEFIVLMKPLEAHFVFFGLLLSKSKMENNYLFTKNFAWCLVPFCKMMN